MLSKEKEIILKQVLLKNKELFNIKRTPSSCSYCPISSCNTKDVWEKIGYYSGCSGRITYCLGLEDTFNTDNKGRCLYRIEAFYKWLSKNNLLMETE